jgi:hypothetical protein
MVLNKKKIGHYQDGHITLLVQFPLPVLQGALPVMYLEEPGGLPAQPGLIWRNLEGYPTQPGLIWSNLEGYPAQPGLA